MNDIQVFIFAFLSIALVLFILLLATDRMFDRPWWYRYIPLSGIIVCLVGFALEVSR